VARRRSPRPRPSGTDVGDEPLRIVPHDARWPRMFEAERELVEAAVGDRVETMDHVGSTAVPGLYAKPVIDVLVVVRSLGDAEGCVRPLEGLGYECRGEAGVPGRLFFRKFRGGLRAFHLHMAGTGSGFWGEHLLFRDYLREHPQGAREYARLKRELAERFRDDREAYSDAKAGFVREVVRLAGAARC
jgi:GrpB-like predicted nucleotidyltransferase (UPF0157 family)